MICRKVHCSLSSCAALPHSSGGAFAMKGAESTEKLHFFYEEQSVPTFADYNGIKCRYIHNAHGGIVGIVDSADNLVVE